MRPTTALVAVAGLLALGGCGAGAPGAAASAEVPITVLAASSLQDAFGAVGRDFEALHPGTQVVLAFAGSPGLAQQILSGAPADVFASASPATMQVVVDAGAAAGPEVFATNSMQIAVPAANPAGVTSLRDLADPDVKVAVCQPEVPCGSTAATVFSRAGVHPTPVTLEPDARSVLGKVRLGEVDAGMVYVTDVRSAGPGVVGVTVPASVNAATSYPIAALTGSTQPEAAREFVEYVLSPAGQALIAEYGFAAP